MSNPAEIYFIFLLSFFGAFTLWLSMQKKLKTTQLKLKKILDSQNQLKEKEKNEQFFLAQISHELRTPINGVIGMLDALKDTPVSPEQFKYINMADQASNYLLTLVNNLLDLSKMNEKKLILEEINFNLIEVIQEVLGLMEKLCEKKNIPLTFHEKNILPKTVKGDPIRLKQILYNLIGNAIKFTEGGFIQLTAELLTNTNNKIKLQFEVIDTGIGINQKQQQDIFEPFSQADASIARQYGGTGLGLALCQQLTELMGGNLALTSEQGKGTSVTFSVYFQKTQLPYIESPTEIIPSSTFNKIPATFHAKVLIVEDNEINQIVAVNRLTKLGCLIETAADGQQALDVLKRKKFDLIFMDCQIPVLDGYKTTEQFRLLEKANNQYKRTPIIAITANVMPTDKQLYLDAGMDDYITKPITDSELRRVLHTYLK